MGIASFCRAARNDTIEAVIPWDEFTESFSEAELLARTEGFDHQHLVGENFATLRRYTAALLEVLELRAAPAAQGVLAAVQTLREMNADNLRNVQVDAPTTFIKPRWKPLLITPEGLDRCFYEICALSELKNALRSGSSRRTLCSWQSTRTAIST